MYRSLAVLRSPITLGFGLLFQLLVTSTSASGQTELYRFPAQQPVVVYRSSDPAYSVPVPSGVAVVSTPPVIEAAPVVTYSPVVAAPVVVPQESGWMPAETQSVWVGPTTEVFRPQWQSVTTGTWTANEWTPVVVETYRPTVALQPVVVPPVVATAVPTTTYFAPVIVPVQPVVVARPARVPGQPIRNLFRAIAR
jgi:hypothetical protein